MREQRIITRFGDGSYRSADGLIIALEVSRPEGGRQLKEWVLRDQNGNRLAGAARLSDLVRAHHLRFGKQPT